MESVISSTMRALPPSIVSTPSPFLLRGMAPGADPVLRSTYGFPGSERDLQDRELINSGFLGPFKARILPHVLAGVGADRRTIATVFDAASGAVAMPG
ncbi:MAG: hypothetical protein ACRDTX_23215 [Pseudonocardiaceae bacterium]